MNKLFHKPADFSSSTLHVYFSEVMLLHVCVCASASPRILAYVRKILQNDEIDIVLFKEYIGFCDAHVYLSRFQQL